MSPSRTVRFYLEPPLRESAEKGAHNFIGLMAEVCEKARYRLEYCDISESPGAAETLSLTHMQAPRDAAGLVFRRVYEYPFWQIDQTAERWAWDVARAAFDPARIDGAEAERFYRFWQKRLYQQAPQTAERGGFVYVPLQGKLADHRSFQACSPLDMVEHCLAQEPSRPIVATLHPKEHYSDAELNALERLAGNHPRLSIRRGGMVECLTRCDYVVTQNSSAAFAGYFFGKPALLFGKIDFHHIAVQADPGNLGDSFARVAAHRPDYARYVWWFWQDQSINAGKPDARDKIAARLRRFGWDT